MILEGRAIAPDTGHAAGRALLADMYRRYIGGTMPAIATTHRGKPYWPDSPWHFSISHTRNHVFCVLAPYPIGMDAEEENRQLRPGLEKKILSAGEYAQWESAKDPRSALLQFWVLKEARAKYTGHGLGGYPNQTDFRLPDRRVRHLMGCLVALIKEDAYVI